MGTLCPPSKTRLAILEALIVGEDVETKNKRIKKPAAFAHFM